MNQRILELAEEHGFIHEFMTTGERNDVLQKYKKFAELIIKECMLQCIKVENDVELSDYEGGFKDGALLCCQEIQEHFGIKIISE